MAGEGRIFGLIGEEMAAIARTEVERMRAERFARGRWVAVVCDGVLYHEYGDGRLVPIVDGKEVPAKRSV